jgi:hypothetical protein
MWRLTAITQLSLLSGHAWSVPNVRQSEPTLGQIGMSALTRVCIRPPQNARAAMKRLSSLCGISLVAATNSATAQVVIPFGDYDSDFEKYLVAAVTLALLCFAVWRYFRSGR